MSLSKRAQSGLRALVSGCLALALGIGITACGPADDAPNPPGAAGAGYPVTISHKFGSTSIPAPPKRVVIVGTSTDDLDATLALGVTPVAFFSKDQSTPDARYPWLAGRMDPAKTQVISSPSGVDLEKVVQAQPDLILATGDFGLEQEYPDLAKIAPTVGYQTEWGKQTWQEHVRVVGTALGKKTEADRLVADTEGKIAEVRHRHPGLAGKTFTLSLASSPNEVFTLVTPEDFAVKQIEQLGMKLSPSVAGAEQVSGSPTGKLGAERLDKLDADLVVTAFPNQVAQQGFEANPLVRRIPAVNHGAYVTPDMQTITQLRFPSVLGIPWALDKLRPGLEKAAATP
ncbi:iron-siderophore ABC transporter substrate-binding protein [Saccharopolyspora sp. ID03-671]|uniref:iron-siderophore ABC transporter substrate-binding protein n=1 Tax=Saccharopolyspora sp. ID03-671 TaxID=3073066 RepID=UPI00324EF7EC